MTQRLNRSDLNVTGKDIQRVFSHGKLEILEIQHMCFDSKIWKLLSCLMVKLLLF